MSKEAQSFYEVMFRLWDGMPRADDDMADSAYAFLEALAARRDDSKLARVFRGAVQALHREFDAAPKDRKDAFRHLKHLLCTGNPSEEAIARAVWRAFFPEALHLDDDAERQISLLRESRRVEIRELAGAPIDDAAKQLLFTSNVLLSPPVEASESDVGGEIAAIIQGADEVNSEPQQYWYDHPVPIGIAPEHDEVVYGLAGLAQALAYEKKRGTAGQSDRLTVCLSVSVTHRGLHRWAGPWLKAQLAGIRENRFDGLDVYAFTEADTEKLVNLLTPWLVNPGDEEALRSTFGVDGEYGRHYSFLKALPALWAVLEDPAVKATFKIDLDQVFPQDVLTAETGKSAFEHFMTPLWGALGRDVQGNDVELGMIAGALVNEKDISAGLFTPDIPWPVGLPQGDDLLFYKQRPMAVSTRAELMTRGDGETKKAIHRIHVTGGTNGILLNALRRYRPFTPSFIGRAEDQGYLLSVLSGKSNEAALRYVHAAGLIMRHDKEAFAGAAVKAGKAGSYIGDLIRLFVFSAYAKCLPDGPEAIKKQVDPFTGCFITPIPATLALLRLALRLFSGGTEKSREEILNLAGKRLPEWVDNYAEKSAWIESTWQLERRGWNAYYDALNRLEAALSGGDKKAQDAAEQFRAILKSCKITN